MTKVDLMVLGLLREKPMHGYQLKRVLEEKQADLWSEVSTGHLYYTLKKLKKAKLVAEKTARPGKRPPRHVYSLTDEGKRALKTGLDGLDVHTQRLFFSLDTVIAFARALHLPAGKLEQLLERRRNALEEELEEVRGTWGEKAGAISLAEYLVLQHRLSLLNSELGWTSWALEKARGLDYRALEAADFKKDGAWVL